MRKTLLLIVSIFTIIGTSFADFGSDYVSNGYQYKGFTIHTDIESFSIPNDEYAKSISYNPTENDKKLVEKLNKLVSKMDTSKQEELLNQVVKVFTKTKDKRKQYLLQAILRAIQEKFYKYEIDTFIPQIDKHIDLLSVPAYEMLCKVGTQEASLFEYACQEARDYAYTGKYFDGMSSLAFYVVNEKSNLGFKLDIENSTLGDRYSINDKNNRTLKYLWITDSKVTDITTINY